MLSLVWHHGYRDIDLKNDGKTGNTGCLEIRYIHTNQIHTYQRAT